MKTFLFIAIILPLLCSTQVNPSAADFLDTNNVKAPILCNADFGHDFAGNQYEIPKGSGKHPLFCGSLWIGGYHNGSLHAAANTYRLNGIDFWPGPLDTTNASISVATSNQWDKLWKISRGEIDQFVQQWNLGNVQSGTYAPPSSITTWPAHGTGNQAKYLAPFVDLNNNGLYDPINDGDYPLIKGDQMIWWVINDVLAVHGETGAPAMGIEIQCSAYAYNRPCVSQSQQVINNTTFYNYKIINRTANNYDSSAVGFFLDPDIGAFSDDYVGCDVRRNIGFAYNGNGSDGIYGASPPAFSCMVIKGPTADLGDMTDNERDSCIDCTYYLDTSTCQYDLSILISDNVRPEKIAMSSFMYLDNTQAMPSGGVSYYDMLTQRWPGGAHLTYGSDGTVTSNPACAFAFPGGTDPNGWGLGYAPGNPPIPAPGSTTWTEHDLVRTPGDRKMFVGMGRFTLLPYLREEVEIALLYSRDQTVSGNLGAIQAAQSDADALKLMLNCHGVPMCSSGIGMKENTDQKRIVVYPNPASDKIRVNADFDFKKARIINAIGEKIEIKYLSPTEIDISPLNPGIYFLQLVSQKETLTLRFVKE